MIEQLIIKIPASQVVIAVRMPAQVMDANKLGFVVRAAHDDGPETFLKTLKGVLHVPLILSYDLGRSVQ